MKVDYYQWLGDPGSTICKVAQDAAVDTILIRSRGHRGMSELFLGSTSNYVLHHAPCSVWVIQKKAAASSEAVQNQRSATVS